MLRRSSEGKVIRSSPNLSVLLLTRYINSSVLSFVKPFHCFSYTIELRDEVESPHQMMRREGCATLPAWRSARLIGLVGL